ncbi:MAG: hypothetical protein KDA84_28685 [Planctomycetaceae bacterium]|nr:hypothetical protein [Planctomycetaceae bacterium]
MEYEIREMKIGGVLDQGLAVFKDNFRLLFGIMLYVYVPYKLITTLIQLAILPDFLVNPNPGGNPNVPPNFDMDALIQMMVVIFAFAIVEGLIVIPLTNAAVIFAVAQRYLGEEVTAGEAIRKGLSKILPLLGTSLLVFFAVLGGMLLCIVPGIIFALWFSLAHQVVVLEDTSGPEALGRSKKLVSPYLGPMFVLGIVVTLIGGLGGGALGFVPQPHVRGVLTVFVQAMATMFSTAVFVVFYFSCRCGVENFDLQHLADSVDESVVGNYERSAFEYDDDNDDMF